MTTRSKGQKHIEQGSTSSTSHPSHPTAKRGRGRPRKNPPPLAPIPPSFQSPRPRPPPLLNPIHYTPPRFRMEDEVENPPGRQNNLDGQNPLQNPPAPPRNWNDRNYRYDDEDDERPVGDYMTPTLEGSGSAIVPLEEDAFDFDVKLSLVHMVTKDQYHGIGNPSTHLANFQEYCRTYKPRDVPAEYVYLKLFPSSLFGDAKEWLQNQEAGSFRTWNELANVFLAKFFHPSRTKKFTDYILTFSQRDNELFHQAYDRFKHYLRECRHHNFRRAGLMRYFYLGMNKDAKSQMDTASGGAIMDLLASQGFKVIDKIATNFDRYQGVDHKKIGKSREDSSNYVTKDQFGDLVKKMDSMISMVNALDVSKPENDKGKNPSQQSCFLCSSTKHSTKACPDGKYEDDEDVCEETHYVNQQRNYAPNPSPPTRNYEPPQRRMFDNPGFPSKPQGQNNYQGNYQRQGYSSNQNQGQNSQYSNQGNYQRTSHQQGQASSNTQSNSMMSMMAQMLQNQKETDKRMEQLEAHNKMLENQAAQNAVALKHFGKLPSLPDVNFTEHCNAIFLEGEKPSLMHVNAVTLKSGRFLPTPQGKPRPKDKEIEAEVANDNSEVELQAPTEEEKKGEESVLTRHHVTKIPFPQRLNKSKLDAHFQRFVEILKKLVQIPLKMKDPCRFTIPCSIGAMSFEHPLADLGASVSVMPLATYYKLGLEGMKATKMTLQLADGTKRQPKGVIKYVPVKVDKFYIPCDFVVMDMGNSGNTSLILGRPFLATAGFKVDLGKGKLTLKIGGEKVKIERPMSDQVAILEPCDLKEQENMGAENVEVQKVTKKVLQKLVDRDKDPSLYHDKLPSCHDGVKRKVNAKTTKNEKQTSLWTRAIKQVACKSSKNPHNWLFLHFVVLAYISCART
ncbi:unnamed protein product [Rhodiola kirilowii]